MPSSKKPKIQHDPPAFFLSIFMCIGITSGLTIGSMIGNVPFCLCVGMFAGILLGGLLDQSRRLPDPNDFDLLPASPRDADEIMSIYAACANPMNMWSEDYPNRVILNEDISRGDLLILRSGGKIVACISVMPNDDLDHEVQSWEGEASCVLARLAVSPEHRRAGFARRILVKTLDLAAQRGCDSVRFLCNIGNSPALALYNSMGFRIKDEVNMYGHDYYAMEALLSEQKSAERLDQFQNI